MAIPVELRIEDVINIVEFANVSSQVLVVVEPIVVPTVWFFVIVVQEKDEEADIVRSVTVLVVVFSFCEEIATGPMAELLSPYVNKTVLVVE